MRNVESSKGHHETPVESENINSNIYKRKHNSSYKGEVLSRI